MLDMVVRPISRFFVWWGRELRGVIPEALRSRTSTRRRRTVIALDKSRIDIIEERTRSSRVLASAEFAPGASPGHAVALLDTLNLEGTIGLRVPRDACFCRSLAIPASAERDAASLALLDLERATPFRAADVMTAVLVEPEERQAAGQLLIRQFVLKRETVRHVLSALEARGLRVAFVDCWAEDRKSGLPVNFLDLERGPLPVVRGRAGLNRTLAAGALFGALAALFIVYVKHENALTAIELEMGGVRQAAADVGRQLARSEATLNDVHRLRQMRGGRPFAIELIEEVTRLLPDGAFLTELGLDGEQLDLTGYAESAAPLLAIFEQSRLFVDARFSAPSRLDARQNRERFSIRVRLRSMQSNAGTLPPDRKG